MPKGDVIFVGLDDLEVVNAEDGALVGLAGEAMKGTLPFRLLLGLVGLPTRSGMFSMPGP